MTTETAKAITTLGAVNAPTDPAITMLSPISRVTQLGDGSIVLHDITVTSETPDTHGESIDYDSFVAAAPEFMKWATVGEMHDPDRWDAGTVLRLHMDDDARKATADLHIVDPTAVKKVLAKVYKAVSIHGQWRDRSWVEVAGRRVRKLVLDFVDEISLVPRGANPDATFAKRFVVAKRDVQPADEAGPPQADEDPSVTKAAVAAPAADPETTTTEAAAPSAPDPKKAAKKAAAEIAKAAKTKLRTDREIAKAMKLVAKAKGAKKGAFGGKKAAPFKAAEGSPAEEAAETPAEEDAETKPDGDEVAKSVALRALRREERLVSKAAKARKVAKAAKRQVRKMRGRSSIGSLTRTLAKAGARNNASDQAKIAGIHDLTVGLGFGKCVTKSDAVHDVAIPAAATLAADPTVAKSAAPLNAIDFEATLREVVPQISAQAVAAMEATLGKKVDDLSRAVAKIGNAGAGGGPLAGHGYFDPTTRQFVPLEGATGPVAKGQALSAAADSLPEGDPLKRELGAAAAKADLMSSTPWRR